MIYLWVLFQSNQRASGISTGQRGRISSWLRKKLLSPPLKHCNLTSAHSSFLLTRCFELESFMQLPAPTHTVLFNNLLPYEIHAQTTIIFNSTLCHIHNKVCLLCHNRGGASIWPRCQLIPSMSFVQTSATWAMSAGCHPFLWRPACWTSYSRPTSSPLIPSDTGHFLS